MGHFTKNVLFAYLNRFFLPILGLFLLILPVFTPSVAQVTENSTLRQAVELASVSTTIKTEKIAVETAQVTKVEQAAVKTTQHTASSTTNTVTSSTKTSANQISVAGRTTAIFNTTTQNFVHDAGNRVASWYKLLYGHNYDSIFGRIRYLKPGETFTVTRNGQTKTYRVERVTAPTPVTKISMQYMKTATYYDGSTKYSYDLVLMTCSGNRIDPSTKEDLDRTLVFANEVK